MICAIFFTLIIAVLLVVLLLWDVALWTVAQFILGEARLLNKMARYYTAFLIIQPSRFQSFVIQTC